MNQKEAAKIRKQNQRKRDKEKMSHPENVTLLGENVTPSQSQDVTPDVTLYRYVDGEKEILREVPEGYQVLSDGQVWEPLKEARKVKLTGRALQYRLNELGQSVKEIDSETGARLMMVCKSLKNHNQLDSVRYGVQGPTMGTVGESLIPAG